MFYDRSLALSGNYSLPLSCQNSEMSLTFLRVLVNKDKEDQECSSLLTQSLNIEILHLTEMIKYLHPNVLMMEKSGQSLIALNKALMNMKTMIQILNLFINPCLWIQL